MPAVHARGRIRRRFGALVLAASCACLGAPRPIAAAPVPDGAAQEQAPPRPAPPTKVPPGAIPENGRFGLEFGNGLAGFFSDVAGYHVVAASFRLDLPFDDSSAMVSYAYTRFKWLLGLAGHRASYPSSDFTREQGTIGTQPADIRREVLKRQISGQLLVRAVYPLSVESRLVLGAGFESLEFRREERVRAFVPGTDLPLQDRRNALPAPPGIALGTVSTSIIKQAAYVGLVSPTYGEAYRFEAAAYAGRLSYLALVGDYRLYRFAPGPPFTLAFRALHYGRYGPGAGDPRLSSLFIGEPSLVRGYDLGSALDSPRVDAFNRWSGDRVLAVNLEYRFPFFYALGIGPGYYGPLPLEVYSFVDAGVAWSGAGIRLFGSGRRAVASAGVGLRVNVLGVVAGVHLVYPFDRSARGLHLQVSFFPIV